ncbi:MAG: T9SS type A sorting domain-containing protein [Candidatus Marinimicrobia bacterium]|nr:T9SS type A sorting domain-containing protein [Candidatus Neomarinimicrobiota bacterium]MCF7921722.1 T9SS type A sorting domain-containing protein [Candidatus Neomarinimicrobiota bacterium]
MQKFFTKICFSLLLMTFAFSASGPLAFKNLLENYPAVQGRYNWESYQRGDFLIIANDAVLTNLYMEPFRVFKEQQGFRVTMAPLSLTGNTTTSIRQFIVDFYQANALEYVLLIGDVNGAYALPAFSYGPENDVSDLPYVLIEGGADDYYPEAFIGRWPVDTSQELAKLIVRTMNYARTPDIESGYLERALVTAGNYSDTGTILTPVWTSLWLRNELVDFGYSNVDTVFYPPTTGPEQILNIWNDGVGIVNYRGWGDAHGWHFPHFHVLDFDEGALHNGNKLPIVFSFVCGTGKFDSSIDPAFCEALLTQGTVSVPAGAVAVVAPSDLHTRTKFNNALNSKLWDALMEGHVDELGPALLASKFGFLDEFVNELDPGEMAEFYYHTYNVMGDPSLPVWLLNPEPIVLNAADFGEVSWDDGLITLDRPDLPDGVFALRQNNALIGSGRWSDGHIRIYRFDGSAFYDEAHPTAALEISLNSPGHTPATIELTPVAGNGVVFAGMLENVHVGMANWTPQLHNYTGQSATVSLGLRSPDGVYNADLGNVTIPAGGTVSAVATAAPIIHLVDREIVMDVLIDEEASPVAIPVSIIAPEIAIQFDGHIRPLPDAAFNLLLSGKFKGLDAAGSTVHITLSSAAEFASLSDFTGTATLDAQGNLIFSDNSFSGSISNVAHGSRLPLQFDFRLDNQSDAFYHKSFMVIIGSESSSDPTPPLQNDGYWAYDNTDAYPEMPTYSWTDLSTQAGAQHYLLSDDDHEIVTLPFSFKYYDTDYDILTINSNGWAAFGPDNINYFRNWSIPMPLGPDAMLAPFWDDLDNDTLVNGVEVGRPIDIYTYHDQSNQRFVVEWHEVWNGFGDRSYLETFQIILHDPSELVADDGNGVIEFQYYEVNDVDQINNYSTVGIESPDQNDGLMYVYARNYAPGAAELAAGRIIRFTTNPPDLFWAAVENEIQQPAGFEVGSAYPNPFNGSTTIPFNLLQAGDVSLDIYDLLGRRVMRQELTSLAAGSHRFKLQTAALASGVYLLRIEQGEAHYIQKITLLK